ncbi:flagellar filament capping protein FliD [Pseudoduganella sp. UC29_106]|uniref:flagellar filament capping protein FliD n=1 Tax=Pseudoduganella sp. UC29_106 TaxID=3374553 RepID=UPI003756E8B1
MATSSVPTYDPQTTAKQLAQLYIQGRQDLVDAQGKVATATSSALTKLGGSLSTFQSVLSSMGTKKSVLANTATFSSDVGTATASATASAGTYNFYVEQLATAGQVSYGGVTDADSATAGDLTVTLADGTNFVVTLANADKNLDNKISAKEIAAAINGAAGNNSRVTASTMTINGASTLVLTSAKTGALNDVSLDVSGITDPALAAQLDVSNQTRVVTPQDASVWVGDPNQPGSTQLTQASNTFTVVDGVSMTFTKAQAVGAAPVTLTVANDPSGTAANVQAFVDGWNKLLATFKDLGDHGDAAAGKAPAIFASDAGLTTLRNSMATMLRKASGNESLATFGITLQRDGTLALDTARLNKKLAIDPTGLDSVFGNDIAGTGVLGGLSKLMDQWTDTTKGQITARKDSNTKLQASITTRQAALSTQYDNAYKRYLTQFTQLQALQSQMSNTGSIFDALFSKSSDN